jgi:hypothetical protein
MDIECYVLAIAWWAVGGLMGIAFMMKHSRPK